MRGILVDPSETAATQPKLDLGNAEFGSGELLL